MSNRYLRILAVVVGLVVVLSVGGLIGAAIVRGTLPDGPYISIPAETDSGTEPGVVVTAVVDDGPAADAGILRGDILLEIDGETLEGSGHLIEHLARLDPGAEIQLTLVRGNEERTVTVTLGEDGGLAYLGVVPCMQMLDRPWRTSGVIVAEVVAGCSAAEAGLERGDVIIAVDGEEVDGGESLADVIRDHEPGDEVTLLIRRDGDDQEVVVELGEHPENEGNAYLGVRYTIPSRLQIVEGGPTMWMEMPYGLESHLEFSLHELVQGIVVLDVAEDSPAEAAGIVRGDLITGLDDEEIESRQALIDHLADLEPGDEIVLQVYRRGEDEEEQGIEVVVGENPDDEGKAYLGILVSDLYLSSQRYGRSPQPVVVPRGEGWLIFPFGYSPGAPELFFERFGPMHWPEGDWLLCDPYCLDDDV